MHSRAFIVGGSGGEIGDVPGRPVQGSGASERKNEAENPFSPWEGRQVITQPVDSSLISYHLLLVSHRGCPYLGLLIEAWRLQDTAPGMPAARAEVLSACSGSPAGAPQREGSARLQL